ncbi:MAG TPA: hypothetical protein DDW52_30350 [Planctomycetaceae bacterium]|nr:hypothetical protein [Planctomycetaceae bacterium]
MIKKLVTLVVTICLSSDAYSQSLTFKDCIERLAASRARVLSYVAVAKVVEYRSETFSDKKYFSAVTNQYECVSDRTAKCSLIVRSASSASVRDVERKHRVMLKRGEEFYFNAGRALKLEQRQKAAGMFDPTVVGIGFCVELLAFYEDWEVINNFRQWNTTSWPLRKEEGSLLAFGSKLGSGRKGQVAVFDKSKGYSISELRLPEGSGVAFQCFYKKIDGHWLPTSALYQCAGDGGMVIEIDWIQINKPIDRRVFDPRWVSEQTELEYSPGGRQ